MHADEQAIRELVATWLQATSAGDNDTVLDLMDEDVVFLTPGQPPMRGRAAFAAAQTGLQQFRIDAVSDIQEIRVSGDWAYCWTKLTVTVRPREGKAEPVRRAGHTLSVLQKLNGNWVIVRDANMLTVVSES